MTDTIFQKEQHAKREDALKLVEIIAAFKQEGEDGFKMGEDEDAEATYEWLVNEARAIVTPKAPVRCSGCGEADRSKGAHGAGRCR